MNDLARAGVTLAVVALVSVAAKALFVAPLPAQGERSSVASDRLATCLFGDPPVNDEAAALLVRGTQLRVMGVRPADPSDPGWPARCAVHARAVAEDERSHGRKTTLAEAAERLAATLEDTGSRVIDWTTPLLAWLKDERAASRVLHRAAEVVGPPPPVHVVTVDSLDPRARLLPSPLSLSSLRLQPIFDESLALVVDAEAPGASARYCLYASAGADPKLSCAPVRAAADSASLRVPGTRETAGASFVFAGNGGKGGVFAVDTGERLAVPTSFDVLGSHALDGGLDVLGKGDLSPVVRLVHVENSTKYTADTPVVALTPNENERAYYDVGLFWNAIVTKGFVPGAPGLRLRVRAVKGGKVEPLVDVGAVGQVSRDPRGRERQLEGCRAAGTVSLRVKGWDNEYFSFRVGERWTAPVEGESLVGVFTCRGAESVIVDERGHVEAGLYEPRVTESRCTPSGCTLTSVETREVFNDNRETTPEEARDVAVAPLGDKLLLVWSAGDVGGLRMRLGRIAEIAKGSDVVLFDDHLEAGRRRLDSTLVAFALRPVIDGVLLFLETTAGVFLYRLDDVGGLGPVAVQHR